VSRASYRTDGPLTPGQQRVLMAVRDLSKELGRAPSYPEIMRRCGFSSPATLHEHVVILRAKRVLRRAAPYQHGVEVEDLCEACGGSGRRSP
jgi:SOS-response transcriptional repressor LexA